MQQQPPREIRRAIVQLDKEASALGCELVGGSWSKLSVPDADEGGIFSALLLGLISVFIPFWSVLKFLQRKQDVVNGIWEAAMNTPIGQVSVTLFACKKAVVGVAWTVRLTGRLPITLHYDGFQHCWVGADEATHLSSSFARIERALSEHMREAMLQGVKSRLPLSTVNFDWLVWLEGLEQGSLLTSQGALAKWGPFGTEIGLTGFLELHQDVQQAIDSLRMTQA